MARGMLWLAKVIIPLVTLSVLVSCALFTTDHEGGEDMGFAWNGLEVDSRIWTSAVEPGREVLRHVPSEGCYLEMIRGGSEVPPDWTVDKFRTTLGDIGYETFEVRSHDGIEYVNYFYRPGDEPVNIGGFQVRPGVDPVTCIEAAEALLSTLDPEGLRLRTPTPAG